MGVCVGVSVSEKRPWFALNRVGFMARCNWLHVYVQQRNSKKRRNNKWRGVVMKIKGQSAWTALAVALHQSHLG